MLCVFSLEAGKTKLEKFDPKALVISSGKFNLRREIDIGNLLDLEVGKTYCIIPCTLKGEVEGEPFKDIDFSINFYFSNCPESDLEFLKANGPGPLKKEKTIVQAVDPGMASNGVKLKNFIRQSLEDVEHDHGHCD